MTIEEKSWNDTNCKHITHNMLNMINELNATMVLSFESQHDYKTMFNKKYIFQIFWVPFSLKELEDNCLLCKGGIKRLSLHEEQFTLGSKFLNVWQENITSKLCPN
jgi:hypothetical protein